MQKIYDIVIIWAWAAWLFASINSPKYLSKLILEKNSKPWVKVLLSGWERANVSNIDIEAQRDYFGQNTKALIWMFKKFNNYDLMWFFADNWVNIVEEDRWRLILESWNSSELLDVLLRLSKQNNTDLRCDAWVEKINKINDIFEIILNSWEKILSKNVVITVWWQSFSQVWTTWDGYAWARNFWHTIITPQRGLCWLVSKKNFEEISWVSCDLQLELFYKNNKKCIYSEYWPLLFTHFWLSWPIIFNTAVALWNFINSLDLKDFINTLNLEKIPKNEIPDYITREYLKENIYIKLTFTLESTPKRIVKFFDLENELNLTQEIFLQDFRTRREAKVTTWWVKLDELDNNLQSKLTKNLYFAWEILDITGKTGWYNLQFCWTTWAIVWKSFANK